MNDSPDDDGGTASRILGTFLGGAGADAANCTFSAHTQLLLYTADGLTDFLQWAAQGIAADPTACVWLAGLRWYAGQGLPVSDEAPPAAPRWIDAQRRAREPRNPPESAVAAFSATAMSTRNSPILPAHGGDAALHRSAAVGLLPYYQPREIYTIASDVAALTDAAVPTWHCAAILACVLHHLARGGMDRANAVRQSLDTARQAGAPQELLDQLETSPTGSANGHDADAPEPVRTLSAALHSPGENHLAQTIAGLLNGAHYGTDGVDMSALNREELELVTRIAQDFLAAEVKA